MRLPPLDVDVKDVVRFRHCRIQETGVRDDLNGSVIRLNEIGRQVVEFCDGSRTVGDVAGLIAERYGVGRDRVLADVLAFLDSMERRGLVRIRRDPRARLSPLGLLQKVQALLALRIVRTERRRFPATAAGCAAATVRATRLPLLLALATAPPMGYVILLQPAIGPPGAALAASVPLVVVVLVQATIWLHEIGHLLALPGGARGNASFTARPMHISLSFEHCTPARRRWVAVAGPLSAIAACVVVSVAITATDLPAGAELPALLVAMGHLVSLLPWAHDGRLLLTQDISGTVEEAHAV